MGIILATYISQPVPAVDRIWYYDRLRWWWDNQNTEGKAQNMFEITHFLLPKPLIVEMTNNEVDVIEARIMQAIPLLNVETQQFE